MILLPVAFLLSKVNMTAMWYAFPIAEVVCLGIAIIFFIKLQRNELSKM